MAQREIFFDSNLQRLVADLVGYQPIGAVDTLTEGDTAVDVDIYTTADYAAYSSAAVKLAIALPDDGSGSNRAKAGTFYVHYEENLTSGALVSGRRYLIVDYNAGDDFANVGASSNASGAIFTASGTTPTTWANGSTLWLISADLAYNVSAENLQVAIRVMSAALSDVTVTGNDGGPFTIVGGTFAALSDFSFAADNLVPQCESVSILQQSGDGLSRRHKQRVELRQVACALVTSATPIDAGTASLTDRVIGEVDEIAAVIDLEIVRAPYEGSVSFFKSPLGSPSVGFAATASQIATAVDSLFGGLGKVTAVTLESGPVRYRTRLTFDASLGPVEGLSVNGDGLTFALGRRFSLDLDTINMVEALSGTPDRLLGIELELTNGSTKTTAFSSSVRINNDLIANASALPLSAETYLTSDEVADGYVAHLGAITSLTGGGATDLDGQNLAGVTLGRAYRVVIAGVAYDYRTEASVSATSSPNFIRAADWATSGAGYRLLGQRFDSAIIAGEQKLGNSSSGLINFSAAISYDFSTSNQQFRIQRFALDAGAGDYTAIIVLVTTGQTATSVVEFAISLPAAADRVVEIRNGSSGGTLLESFTSLAGGATRASFRGYFDGSAWQPLISQQTTP